MSNPTANLKKFFTMMAVWLVVIIAIFAGSHFYKLYQGSQFESTAVPYLQRVVPVLAEWDAEKTRALMAPESAEMIPEESFARIVALFSKLGTLQSTAEPHFDEIADNGLEGEAKRTFITYRVAAQFSNGSGMFKIQLVDKGGELAIYNFNISSDVLNAQGQ